MFDIGDFDAKVKIFLHNLQIRNIKTITVFEFQECKKLHCHIVLVEGQITKEQLVK
jgi:hypothetical protein